MITIEQLQVLTKQVTAQSNFAQQLLENMASEHVALLAADADSLDIVIDEKQALLKQLEAGLAAITQSISKHGFAADFSGFDALLQQLPENTPLHRQWERLQELADECKQQNEVNGSIVSLKQRHIRQALDILKGAPPSKNTYDKQGTIDSYLDKNSYTKA
jgi:flagella synthesis protein FlgN